MIQIDVYADVVCPWCYIGEKRLERTLEQRPDLTVERRWRPFQLRPEMPEGGLPWREFAMDKFGGEDKMRAAFGHVSEAGEADGIAFDFGRVASAPNTVDAHRLILHAAEHGHQWETVNALFEAYFSGGANLNDHEELAQIAVGAGMDANRVRGFLDSGEAVHEVWSAQKEASRIGATGVPFYVFDNRYALSGAQSVATFTQALDATQRKYAV